MRACYMRLACHPSTRSEPLPCFIWECIQPLLIRHSINIVSGCQFFLLLVSTVCSNISFLWCTHMINCFVSLFLSFILYNKFCFTGQPGRMLNKMRGKITQCMDHLEFNYRRLISVMRFYLEFNCGTKMSIFSYQL